ncbi:hypothetical protein H7S74_28955 [Priestia aryabhattai]|jgi:hypothetical protein|uniref:hypothetical protein n=1 Tax=Priestia aryabhattai TaxID=412384 RepID=UPI001EC5DC10|nr:hypothetical protein [Priestia aryabhattai]MBY0090329.1 hypothetical protein [Priestia aryabhattai]MBY0105349.1 hypothetical protein [Priestia aryabhattai]
MAIKKNVLLELDEIHMDQNDLRNTLIEYFTVEGKRIHFIDKNTLFIDNQKYTLTEKFLSVKGIPRQQLIFSPIE